MPFEGTSAKIVPTGGRLGTGRACPNVRNFDMVDQDQSDNVTSVYLLNPATGQTAQDTAANETSMTGNQALSNGSDNALVDKFMDPALGCTPFMARDLANNNTPTTSQALDELLAAARRNTPRIPALVPENDPMVLDADGNLDPAKTNLYRAEVGQPAINRQNDKWDSPANYCQNMINIQGPFLAANQAVLAGARRRCRTSARICTPSWPTGCSSPSTTSAARTSASPTPSTSSSTGRRGYVGHLQHHPAAGDRQRSQRR